MLNNNPFNENLNLTIGEILEIKEENFKSFIFFFNRVIELCQRECDDKNINDYINGLKCLTLLEIESFINPDNNFESVQNQLNISEYSFKFSLIVLQAAYKYCFYQNSFLKLVGMDKIYDIEHILSPLFALEDITVSRYLGKVHKHFLNKYIESEKNKKSKQASLAAKIRHYETRKRDEKNIIEVKRIWNSSNWRSYTQCADYIHLHQLVSEQNFRKIYKLVSQAAKSRE